MMVKNELQFHNRPEIQNEYYIFISKKLINKLLIRSNSIIKQKRKEMNQEEANEILKIIDEICDLHIFQFKTKTSISEFVMQDMIKIIHNMMKNGIQMDINLPISIKNVDFNEYLHRDQKNIKYEKTEIRDIMSQEDVIDSIKKAIWYIVKILDSETRRSTNAAYLNKYCTIKDNILIEKSKLINYNVFYELDKKTLDNLEGLKLSQYVIMVARNSPYLLAIFNQYHKNQLNQDIK